MARISYRRKVSNASQAYIIVRIVREKARRLGYTTEIFRDDEKYGVVVRHGGEEFKLLFRRCEDGGYIAGGEFSTENMDFFRDIYTILRKVKAGMYVWVSEVVENA